MNESKPIYAPIKPFQKTSGLSEKYIRKRLQDGTLPHIMAGNKYLINVPAALELLDKESKGA